MRKIERQMNQAIRSGKNFSSSNTTVRHGFEGKTFIYMVTTLLQLKQFNHNQRWRLAIQYNQITLKRSLDEFHMV